MTDAPRSLDTPFSRDVLGRRLCATLDDVLKSSRERPIDVVIIGAGAFGAAVAERIFAGDKDKRLRVLVLEAGPFALPEHAQNIPVLDFGAPEATTIDELKAMDCYGPHRPRGEVWGLAWRSNTRSPGLAYCIGGRSLFWSGWAIEPLRTPEHAELDARDWPEEALADLGGRYLREAAEQLGVTQKNDFLHSELHDALRAALFEALHRGAVRGAVPLSDLPDGITVPPRPPAGAPSGGSMFATSALLDRGLSISKVMDLLGLPNRNEPLAVEWVFRNAVQEIDLLHLLKIEAPLGVQSRTRTGLFPFNKWSSVPALLEAVQAARREAEGRPPRLSVLPFCNVRRVIIDGGRPRAIDTNLGQIPLADNGVVVLANGAIESARIALNSLSSSSSLLAPAAANIGRGLSNQLASRLVIRVPRPSLDGLLEPAVHDLQAAALVARGQHRRPDGRVGHFHIQIAAAGLGDPEPEALIELFRKTPDIDDFEALKAASADYVIIAIRGVGEMEPHGGASRVELSGELDEFGAPRAQVSLEPSALDLELWDALDRAMDDIAAALSRGATFEVVTPAGPRPVGTGDELASVVPYAPLEEGGRRLGLGALHHEAGTLQMNVDPRRAAADVHGQILALPGVYAAGVALCPTLGSASPMLTGMALARRLGDHLIAQKAR